jgi:hypothetical protein
LNIAQAENGERKQAERLPELVGHLAGAARKKDEARDEEDGSQIYSTHSPGSLGLLEHFDVLQFTD